MQRFKRRAMILIILMCLLISGCRREAPGEDIGQEEGEKVPAPEEMILSAESWKEEFPLIYESFIKTSRLQDQKVEDTELGGLHPIDYLEKYPNIATLYEGMGFAKEYYIARGHYYSLEDVINTSRPKPGASCLACKTADYEKLYVKNGEALFAMDFQETSQVVDHAISCYNCHRNDPGRGIQVTSPHYQEGIKLLEQEPKPGTNACAQCHVEYYLDPDTKAVVLPWDQGIEIDEIEAYYDELDFSDWTHPRTGTPLIKVQHPEFEMYTGSIHDSLGLSCADCHMPVVVENGESYKSHWAKSPLKTVIESCGSCHGDDAEAIVAMTQEIQKEIHDLEVEVSDLLVQLINNFATALEEQRLNESEIKQLRELHRKAQYRWDFVFVENSTGFHNQQKAREALEKAKEYAQQALTILQEAQ